MSKVNNAEKTAKINDELFIIEQGVVMPVNALGLILEKAKMHATQAFLMENIKGKDELINQLKKKQFTCGLIHPNHPEYVKYDDVPLVNESWGWEQLSMKEVNEYLMAESYASHIGQFIHKGSNLDKLRKEIITIGNIEWIDVKAGEKTPVKVTPHHTSEQLLQLHEEFASLHRQYEQKVNYYKAKVKNLVTEENARISNINANAEKEVNEHNKILQQQYEKEYREYSSQHKQLYSEFEAQRQNDIKSVASLRIEISNEFKDVIDEFLNNLNSEE